MRFLIRLFLILRIVLVTSDIHIKLTDKAKDYLVNAGYDVNYGARPLKREVSKTIESLLAHSLIKGTVKYGETVTFDVVMIMN